jgi:hypothetical protein
MKVQLINPDPGAPPERHARIVPLLDTVVLAGEIIDVDPEIAGAGPSWRKPVEGDDLAFMETRLNDDGSVHSVHDLGRGLLAQVDVWAKPPEAKGGAE